MPRNVSRILVREPNICQALAAYSKPPRDSTRIVTQLGVSLAPPRFCLLVVRKSRNAVVCAYGYHKIFTTRLTATFSLLPLHGYLWLFTL